jgi:hypothetical protein
LEVRGVSPRFGGARSPPGSASAALRVVPSYERARKHHGGETSSAEKQFQRPYRIDHLILLRRCDLGEHQAATKSCRGCEARSGRAGRAAAYRRRETAAQSDS